MDRDAVEDRLKPVLRADADVLAAYLFGSFARDEARSDSDVDVAVLHAEQPPGRLLDRFRLEGELERAVGRQVQLVFLNAAPPDLVHRVLRDGRLLLDRDPARRIRFEIAARNAYFDLQPVLRRYRGEEARS